MDAIVGRFFRAMMTTSGKLQCGVTASVLNRAYPMQHMVRTMHTR